MAGVDSVDGRTAEEFAESVLIGFEGEFGLLGVGSSINVEDVLVFRDTL